MVFLRRLVKGKDERLKQSSAGEAVITLIAVIVNGSSFDWGYEKAGWRLLGVERKTVTTVESGKIEILQFDCSLDTIGVRIKTTIDKSERILIPAGKEAEAAKVIERLQAEINRFAEYYSS